MNTSFDHHSITVTIAGLALVAYGVVYLVAGLGPYLT